MMTITTLHRRRDLSAPLETLIHEHGLAAVAAALLRLALRRGKTRPPPLDMLSDHLLRDIGIDPPHRRTVPWELR